MEFKLILAISLLYCASIQAENLFVTLNGSGELDGSSWENSLAYSQLSMAGSYGVGAGKFSPGDTVYISGGVGGQSYTNLTMWGGGSVGNRLTIKTGAAHPTLSSGHDGAVTIYGLVKDQYSFIEISGDWPGFPVVTNAIQASQLTSENYKLKVTNPQITGTTGFIGVQFEGTNNIWSKIEAFGCDDGIGINGFCHGFVSGTRHIGTVIEYCYSHNNTGDGINWNKDWSTYDYATSTNIVIKYCKITDNLQDGVQGGGNASLVSSYLDGSASGVGQHGDGWQLAGGKKSKIVGNIFKNWPQSIFNETGGPDWVVDDFYVYNNVFYYDEPQDYMLGVAIGGKLTSGATLVIMTNVVIANNTFDHLKGRKMVGLGFGNTDTAGEGYQIIVTNCLIANNIFYDQDPQQSPINIDDMTMDGSSCLIKNNVFYLNDNNTYDGVDYTTLDSLVAANPLFTGNVLGQPLFSNYAGHDYSLNDNDTVARNAALNLSAYFTTDILGNPRGTSWDIGAYEYQSSATTHPPLSRRFRFVPAGQ